MQWHSTPLFMTEWPFSQSLTGRPHPELGLWLSAVLAPSALMKGGNTVFDIGQFWKLGNDTCQYLSQLPISIALCLTRIILRTSMLSAFQVHPYIKAR